ncbi:MAG TPA: ATP-binding protein [Ktedonobacterales bacterium]|nr:ATP-binding protein [Ktedonobacterales bacterium]
MGIQPLFQTVTFSPYALYEGALGPLLIRLAERLRFERLFVALLTLTENGERALQGAVGLNVPQEALVSLTVSLSTETEPLARVALTGAMHTGTPGAQADGEQNALQSMVGAYHWAAAPIPYLPDLPAHVLHDLPLSKTTATPTADRETRASVVIPARGVLVAARAAALSQQETILLEMVAGQIGAALLGLEAAQAARQDELEEGRIRQQLFESEKLAATGRLTASIAHEINNPLEAIKNALYLLVAQSQPDNPQRELLELAQRETERVSRIIRQMLGVARPSASMSLTDVNRVVQETLALIEPQLQRRQIISSLELDTTLPPIMASADQLKQVFLNLFLNARDAMPQGGGLLIQTRIARVHDNIMLADKYLVVRVRDDGEGIPEEIRQRVFEPFFSTKGARRGSGLGLWVCQEIIRSHGGQMHINSKVGKGTTFLVGLPLPVESRGAALGQSERQSASSLWRTEQ